MEQANYPNLDRPFAHQPNLHENFNNYPSPGNNFYPQHANNDFPYQRDLQQPLIHNDHHKDKKHEHKHKKKIRRIVSALVGFVCLLIELGVLFYINYSAYIFDYCYWKFGVYHYKSDVDQTLQYGNGKNEREYYYYDIRCYNTTNPFPECPMICDFAEKILNLEDESITYPISLGEVIMVVFVFCLISAAFIKKPKLKRAVVFFFTLISFSIFLGTCVYAVHHAGLFDLEDPDESKLTNFTDDMDEPSDLEAAKGGKLLMGLMAFMLTYRVLLIILAKS